jgi:hypothetical protein
MNRPRKLALAAAVACAALPLLTPATANAAGSLTMTAPASAAFSSTLDGTDQTPTYTLPLTVADTRTGASSAGWNLTITSTQLTAGSKTLATNASSITAAAFACQASCTANPTNSISYPLALPAGAGPPAAVKFYNAAANTGRGTFTITPTIQVAVPANTLTGSYTATLTTAVTSGP